MVQVLAGQLPRCRPELELVLADGAGGVAAEVALLDLHGGQGVDCRPRRRRRPSPVAAPAEPVEEKLVHSGPDEVVLHVPPPETEADAVAGEDDLYSAAAMRDARGELALEPQPWRRAEPHPLLSPPYGAASVRPHQVRHHGGDDVHHPQPGVVLHAGVVADEAQGASAALHVVDLLDEAAMAARAERLPPRPEPKGLSALVAPVSAPSTWHCPLFCDGRRAIRKAQSQVESPMLQISYCPGKNLSDAILH